MVVAASTSSLLRRALSDWGVLAVVLLAMSCGRRVAAPIPTALQGTFVDDYGTRHTIDDSLWQHGTANRYRVIEWNATARFLIARNDTSNVADGGRYDRIDWVILPGDDGWMWAFCLATWNAPSATAARAVTRADTANPRSGCGGYPFTRMRRSGAAPSTEEAHD